MNVTKQLYQWDTGQKLTECTGIYVDYLIGDEVYRVEITDGTCIIPDELLQTSGRYKVWECMADNTLREFAFKVLPRPIPPNYVFTPTEQLTFEGLVQKETNKFNTNAIEKLNAYNANADNRVAEFNAQTEQIQTDVSELKSDLSNTNAEVGATLKASTSIGTYNVAKRITAFKILSGCTYIIDVSLDSASSTDLYVYLKASDNTNLTWNIINSGQSALRLEYTALDDADVYIAVIPQATLTMTISVEITASNNIVAKINQNAIDIADANEKIDNICSDIGEPLELSKSIGTYDVPTQFLYTKFLADHRYSVVATLDSTASTDIYVRVGEAFGETSLVFGVIEAGSLSVTIDYTPSTTMMLYVWATTGATISKTLTVKLIDNNAIVDGGFTSDDVVNVYGTGLVYPFTASGGKFKVEVADDFVLTIIYRSGQYKTIAIVSGTTYLVTPKNALVVRRDSDSVTEIARENIKSSDLVLLETGEYVSDFPKYFTGLFTERLTTTSSSEDFLLHNVSKDYVRDVDDVITEIANDNPCDFNAIIGTDMHITSSTAYPTNRPILNVINRIQSRINADAVLNLGDNVDMGKENIKEAYYSIQQAVGEIDDYVNAYYVVGNHDYNNISGVDVYRQKKEWIIPDDAIYRMYGRLHENDVVWGSRDKVYYYKDFEEKKIRMIVLNTLDKPNDTVNIDGVEYEKYPWLPNIVSSVQVDWFIDEALDFSDKSDKASWSVLVLSHATPAPNVEWNSASLGDLQNSNPQGAQIIKIAEAFSTGTSKSLSYTDTLYGGSATLNRNADFTAQGAIPIIGWLSGHCHIDTKTTINGITYITTVCGYPDSSIGQSSSMSGMEMIAGTYSAFGVDVLSLDKTARKVKLHRIGIGYDREWTY